MLELDEGKLSRPVLRRGSGRNLASLSRPYMDPPWFARTILGDSSKDHDCTHIYGLSCGGHGCLPALMDSALSLLNSLTTSEAVYLSPADKYHRLTRRLSRGQKGL